MQLELLRDNENTILHLVDSYSGEHSLGSYMLEYHTVLRKFLFVKGAWTSIFAMKREQLVLIKET